MKKQFFVIIVIASAFSAAFAQTVERPTLKVGDSCVYSKVDGRGGPTTKYTASVTAVTDSSYQLVEKDESGAVKNSNIPLLEKGEATSSRQLLYPLSVGAAWVIKGEYIGLSVGTQELKATVVGWEEVKVPAGTFSALKVTWEGFYRSSDGPKSGVGRVEITRWYTVTGKLPIKEVYKSTYWGGRNLNMWDVSEIEKCFD